VAKPGEGPAGTHGVCLIGNVLLLPVIPAKVGMLHDSAGWSSMDFHSLENQRPWIPAFAGMTIFK
jgi:hypothetical protein